MKRVAAVQLEITTPPTNVERIIEHIARVDADIICFPETCIISEEGNAREVDSELKQICHAAKTHAKCIVVGSYTRDALGVRNVTYVINEKGQILNSYKKRHAYPTENIIPGASSCVVELAGIKTAIICCWDYAFLEDYRDLGADLILCPSYLLSHPHTEEVLRKLPQVRAFDTRAYFVMVDAYAKESFKRSSICHPLHEISYIEGEPGVIFGAIDIADLKHVREKFPLK